MLSTPTYGFPVGIPYFLYPVLKVNLSSFSAELARVRAPPSTPTYGFPMGILYFLYPTYGFPVEIQYFLYAQHPNLWFSYGNPILSVPSTEG